MPVGILSDTLDKRLLGITGLQKSDGAGSCLTRGGGWGSRNFLLGGDK